MNPDELGNVIRSYSLIVSEREGHEGSVFITTEATDKSSYTVETAPPSLTIFTQLAAFAQFLAEGGFNTIAGDEPDQDAIDIKKLN